MSISQGATPNGSKSGVQRWTPSDWRARREAAEKRPKCPRCTKRLEERHFRTLKVDVCPEGHGVWLDPGELEMILHLPRAEMLRVVHEVDAGLAHP